NESVNNESVNNESVNNESVNNESVNNESVNKKSVNKKSVNKKSVNKKSVNKKSHKNFTDLFAKNSSDAINLRNIKKVLSHIYKQENADKIIEVIVDITSKNITKDITFNNIKNYYRYLKVKEKVEVYLVAYELLFSYPNFAILVHNCKGDNIDHKRKMKKGYFPKNIQGSVKDYSEAKALDEYKKGLKIKPKYISKAVFLFEKLPISELEKLSFSKVGDILKNIDRLSTINDNDLLKDLVLDDIGIEIEKYFTCETEESYLFCKRKALSMIAKKILNNDISFPYEEIICIFIENIQNSVLFLQKNQYFWKEIIEYFIKEKSFELLIKQIYEEVDKKSYYGFQLVDILRILSLVEFYLAIHNDCKLNFTEFKNLKKWKDNFNSNLQNRNTNLNFNYKDSEFYLFELNANLDKQKIAKIEEQIPETPIPIDNDIKDKFLIEQIKEDFESLFTTEIEGFKNLS
ncbi:hypothetical protein, partial [Francisella sciaenopsi]|uniref:hypothetical protein n=1 Tax=Francisella sciaenopsi TaxID=3055034 RepID=UPI0038B269B2